MIIELGDVTITDTISGGMDGWSVAHEVLLGSSYALCCNLIGLKPFLRFVCGFLVYDHIKLAINVFNNGGLSMDGYTKALWQSANNMAALSLFGSLMGALKMNSVFAYAAQMDKNSVAYKGLINTAKEWFK